MRLESGTLESPVLNGSLRAFSPPAVLQLLNMQRQTGLLALNNQGYSALIMIEDGEVVDAELDRLRGLPALLGATSWGDGEFTFFNSAVTERTIDLPFSVVQVRVTLWLDRWREMLTAIPSLGCRITVRDQPSGDVIIKPYQWSILTHVVGGPQTVAALSHTLGEDPLTLTRICYELVMMGLCTVLPPLDDGWQESPVLV